MQHISNALRALVALAACVVSVGQTQPAAARNDHKCQCHEVTAKLMTVKTMENCISPVDFCAAGVVTSDGILRVRAETRATVLGLVPSVGLPGVEPSTTLAFAGERTITTSNGTLVLRFTGVFDTARHEFSELERVIEGSEAFSGATGTLYLYGTANSDNTSFEGQIRGELCMEEPDGH